MRPVTVGLTLLLAGTMQLGASSPTSAFGTDGVSSASGTGTLSFVELHGRDDDAGVGFVQFNVTSDFAVSGSMLFAGEHGHDRYPDIVLRIDDVQQATFQDRVVRFSGKGSYHNQDVVISAVAHDAEGTGRPDSFSVRAATEAGKVLFEARGQLTSGDIAVGPID